MTSGRRAGESVNAVWRPTQESTSEPPPASRRMSSSPNAGKFFGTGTRWDADAQFFTSRMHLPEMGQRESSTAVIQRTVKRFDSDISLFACLLLATRQHFTGCATSQTTVVLLFKHVTPDGRRTDGHRNRLVRPDIANRQRCGYHSVRVANHDAEGSLKVRMISPCHCTWSGERHTSRNRRLRLRPRRNAGIRRAESYTS